MIPRQCANCSQAFIAPDWATVCCSDCTRAGFAWINCTRCPRGFVTTDPTQRFCARCTKVREPESQCTFTSGSGPSSAPPVVGSSGQERAQGADGGMDATIPSVGILKNPALFPSPTPTIPMGRREEAVLWLAALLATDPVECAEVSRRAKQAAISLRTLRRAKKVIDVRSVRVGGLAGSGFWVWVLPPGENGAG